MAPSFLRHVMERRAGWAGSAGSSGGCCARIGSRRQVGEEEEGRHESNFSKRRPQNCHGHPFEYTGYTAPAGQGALPLRMAARNGRRCSRLQIFVRAVIGTRGLISPGLASARAARCGAGREGLRVAEMLAMRPAESVLAIAQGQGEGQGPASCEGGGMRVRPGRVPARRPSLLLHCMCILVGRLLFCGAPRLDISPSIARDLLSRAVPALQLTVPAPAGTPQNRKLPLLARLATLSPSATHRIHYRAGMPQVLAPPA